MQFGANLSQSIRRTDQAVSEARAIEADGFDFVSVTDHLHGRRPSFETWTFLTWIAASTERIGLLTNVLGLPYRHPPVVAKMAESLNRLSTGRLILGLGVGGLDQEFHAFGLPVRRAGEKIEALEEAIEVIRGMWNNPTFTYSGRHISIHEADIEPKPERSIPIWLGVYRPRGLELLGRVADGWIPSLPFAPAEAAVEMMKTIRDAAARAGRDPDQLIYAYNLPLMVGDDETGRAISGEPDQVADRLVALARKGFNAFNFWFVGDRSEQRGLVAKEVLPLVRAAMPR